MLSADDLWRLLNTIGSPLVRESRPQRRELTWAVCQQLGEHLDASGNVSAKQVQEMTARLYACAQQAQTRPLPRRRFTQRAEAILAAMNDLPGLTIQLPPHAHPIHRPTLAPTSAIDMQRLTALRFVDRHLQAWRRTSRHPDRWLLELATRLACRVGMGPEVILGSLALLSYARVGPAKKQYKLYLPVQPLAPLEQEAAIKLDESEGSGSSPVHVHPTLPTTTVTEKSPALEGCYPLVLPKSCRDALAHLRKHAKGNQREWLLLSSPGQPVPALKTRQLHLRDRLNSAAHKMLTDLKVQYPDARELLQSLTGWQSITRTGPLLAQRKGIPALWLQVLARYPLPTCTPEPLVRETDPAPAMPRLGHTEPSAAPSTHPDIGLGIETDDRQVTAPGIHELDMVSFTPEQAVALRQGLTNFLTKISTLTTTGRLASQTQRAPLLDCLRQALDNMTRIIGNPVCYYHLLLHFAYAQLRENENTVSTVATYLQRLTPEPIQFHEAVIDMRTWDQETVDEICQTGLNYPRWRPRTQQHFLITLRLFVRFCQQFGLLEDVLLPSMALEDRVSTLRTAVPNPIMAENAWGSLVGQVLPSQTRQQFALTLALGFYGALRASEVCQLTLADILIEESETGWGEWSALHAHYGQGNLVGRTVPNTAVYCWIYIRRGKTPAARRRIPLHVLAPPAVVMQMRHWWHARRQVEPTLALHNIALFGPLFSPMAYTRRGLIDPLLAWLREQWNCQIDFHGLRHAAVSWLQLRIHAAQYPSFRDTLLHRDHWMFDARSLDTLYSYLCAAEGEHSAQRGSLIGQVAKIIGHRHLGTLTQVYSHTLHFIHADILQRAWSNRG